METILQQATKNISFPLDFDNLRKRYFDYDPVNTDISVVYPSGDIPGLEVYYYMLLSTSDQYDFDPSWEMRPDYTSYDIYGTIIYWPIILHLNNIYNIEEYTQLETVFAPPISSISKLTNYLYKQNKNTSSNNNNTGNSNVYSISSTSIYEGNTSNNKQDVINQLLKTTYINNKYNNPKQSNNVFGNGTNTLNITNQFPSYMPSNSSINIGNNTEMATEQTTYNPAIANIISSKTSSAKSKMKNLNAIKDKFLVPENVSLTTEYNKIVMIKNIETFTLTVLDIKNMYVTLAHTPFDPATIEFKIIHPIPESIRVYGREYVSIEAYNRISWSPDDCQASSAFNPWIVTTTTDPITHVKHTSTVYDAGGGLVDVLKVNDRIQITYYYLQTETRSIETFNGANQ